MRPIDAGALVDMLQNIEDKFDKKAFRDVDFRAAYASGIVQEIKKRVIEAPTLEYEPVRHASWIRQDDAYTRFQCGECKSKNFDRRWVFCPLCGAKMDGGKKDG